MSTDKVALISVYDKTGLEPFVKGLVERGYKLVSTGGTFKTIAGYGLPVIPIEKFTGAPEICEGRVKTLHPRIHGGILARRDNASDMADLQTNGIGPIDLVCVNLYPFTIQVAKALSGEIASDSSLVEYIDIGGPTMLRAAAKNCKFVVPVCDPEDYYRVLVSLDSSDVSLDLRRELAAKVFKTMSAYDAAVAKYFAEGENSIPRDLDKEKLRDMELGMLEMVVKLRYGENPHQEAGLYRLSRLAGEYPDPLWRLLSGKELSYNNLLDTQAAVDLMIDVSSELPNTPASVIIKHTNPCGVAFAPSLLESFRRARDCDPISAFGGIVAVNGEIDGSLAEAMLEGFLEVVIAKHFSEEALLVFERKKAIRLIEIDFERVLAQRANEIKVQSFLGDFLVQTQDAELGIVDISKAVTVKKGSTSKTLDYRLAWVVCKHVKSNAIVVAKGGRVLGVGAGQMSRVDSSQLAVERANTHGHDLHGAVAASDAFLPFPDALEVLARAGVVGLVQPGGSIRDREVIKAADDLGVEMIFTGVRHFRH